MWHACSGLAAIMVTTCECRKEGGEDIQFGRLETVARACRGAEPFGRLASGVMLRVEYRATVVLLLAASRGVWDSGARSAGRRCVSAGMDGEQGVV
jgi:hypothetical protein